VSTIYLITGVTRGLGRALLERCVEDGVRVVACGRSKKAIAELKNEFAEDVAHFSVVDVADAVSVSKWAAEVAAADIIPDVLINNAGIINENAPLWEISDAEFSKVFDVNVRGTTNVIRSFLPLMFVKGAGTIVNFSSGWGRSTSPEVAPYCASKWAVEGLSQALAQELPEGFCCVALNPGIINTEMLQSCFGAGATDYPEPDEWSLGAYKAIKRLKPSHNGRALSV
jgi:NAD(P)-dependent dehydrogenase (short-subunit alcohol dehydrogenase family)